MLRNIVHHSCNKLPSTVEFLVEFQLHRIPIPDQEVAKIAPSIFSIDRWKPSRRNPPKFSEETTYAVSKCSETFGSWGSISFQKKKKKKKKEKRRRKEEKKGKKKTEVVHDSFRSKNNGWFTCSPVTRRREEGSWTSIFAMRQPPPLRKKHRPVLPFCSRRRFLRKLIARAVHEARNERSSQLHPVETGRRKRGSTDNASHQKKKKKNKDTFLTCGPNDGDAEFRCILEESVSASVCSKVVAFLEI